MSKYREIGFEVVTFLDEPADIREMVPSMRGFGFIYNEIEEEIIRFMENSYISFDKAGKLTIRSWGSVGETEAILEETLEALREAGRRVREEPVFIVGREMNVPLTLSGLVDFIKDKLMVIVKKGRVRNTIETEIRNGNGGKIVKITLENLQDWLLEDPNTSSMVRITAWAPREEIDDLSSKIKEIFED